MSFVVNKFLQAKNNMLVRRIRRARLEDNDVKEEKLTQKAEVLERYTMSYVEFQTKVEDWLNWRIVFSNNGLRVRRVPKRITFRCKGIQRNFYGIKIKNAASVEFKVLEVLASAGCVVVILPVLGVMKAMEYRKGYTQEKEAVKRICKLINESDVANIDVDSCYLSKLDGAPNGVARDAYALFSHKYLVYYTFQNDKIFAICEGSEVIETITSGVGVSKIKRTLAKRKEELEKLEEAKQNFDAEKQKKATVTKEEYVR